ncbi:hypothetical protein [Streptomyces sp. NPDC127092]|uniref:hypothetical protein n=1 Tax=Streptomyces sp. NPDC127092 TaxID=3347135 RepID=UPI00364FF15F
MRPDAAGAGPTEPAEPLFELAVGSAAGRAVELVYTPTLADVADAMRVAMRRGDFRQLRWALPPTAALALFVAGWDRFGYGVMGPAFQTVLAGLGLFAGLLWPLAPWVSALRVWPAVVRRGGFRTRVDGDGVTCESDAGTPSGGAEAAGVEPYCDAYVETARQFVLFPSERPDVWVALPKRGVSDPADVDRLRALLDRNLTRL